MGGLRVALLECYWAECSAWSSAARSALLRADRWVPKMARCWDDLMAGPMASLTAESTVPRSAELMAIQMTALMAQRTAAQTALLRAVQRGSMTDD